ncbi:SusC/RagA family TonB-linked outer membrane protein [Paraflavitalea sp. CAU 1676]|uniref:SusC/RagA family TonB-linked outer membrane protein n=1 Tax=Paraflavitalea sp. CAU 1676 TaxID=3032598 RepID=UPI0023DAFFBF|nr:SusC/RagA family TonB-linked outer membrane protein [Paraflavitalea sp. CAU 1676]MDF2187792.1 SusC/RagA family TonB-linked outer membrane protein [Paraflavitalea sp. CAU 1676]
MKLTIILTVGFCFSAAAGGFSQSITLSEKDAKLESVIRKVTKQCGYYFIYRNEWMAGAKKVDVEVVNASLKQVLDICFKGQPLSYSIVGNMVVIAKDPTPANDATLPDVPKQIDIAGVVMNEQRLPLAGASVAVKGTSNGTTTDQQGRFSLRQVDEKAVLQISFVGYQSQEQPVNRSVELSIRLKQSDSKLDETIIIGYGTTTRKKNIGSVSSISTEEISKQPVGNVLNALQGRMAGAYVTQSNGVPGSRVSINIRGTGSLDARVGAQPLYIVDGVPFMMMTGSSSNDLNEKGTFSAAGGISPFNVINPGDIERIDILKDADATAIYGTKGTNGVVLITTKKGKAGKTKLDVNVYQGWGKVAKFVPLMNTQQYLQMRREAFANDGLTPTAGSAPDLMLWDSTADTNWQEKYLGGTASTTDAQVAIAGGDQRTRFILNTGYHRETLVFPGNNSDVRISGRVNVDHNSLDKKFNATVSVSYAMDKSKLLRNDLSAIYNLPPNMPLHKPDGSLWWNANFVNPESYQLLRYFGKTFNLITSTALRYTILPGLDIKASFGYNHLSLEQNNQYPAVSRNPLTTVPTNSAEFANISQCSYIAEPQLTYNRELFGGKLSALLGTTFQQSQFSSTYFLADNYGTAALLGSPAGAGTYNPPTVSNLLYRYNSVFGRLSYDWASKYLFNGVLRRDGSSRFGPGMRFGNFWSVGGAWIFSNELFAKNLSFLSFGKLRGSYGKTGNDIILDYQYRSLFVSRTPYQNSPAIAPSGIDNPLLHWQSTYKLEFGLDLGFLKDRILLAANYYRARNPDQLGSVVLGSQSGFNNYFANFDALIRNTGYEFELNTINVQTKDFKWTSSFNVTIPRTIVARANPLFFTANVLRPGQPLTAELRYVFKGLDEQGRGLYKDFRKDSVTLTPNVTFDKAVTGYSAPQAYGGFNNQLNYKNFELSFFFQFTKQQGFKYPIPSPGVLTRGNQTPIFLNAWRKPGDNSAFPRYSTSPGSYVNFIQADAIWGDASFIRLRNVNLSYTLPASVVKKIKMDRARVYLQAQNVWWTSNRKYVFDPETYMSLPPLRVITAGINFSF